ncbi:hypothetical protein EXIGLDRAFT_108850 [Exidia glandulosa HHB12029]|uniref:Uncharacterized protein n=1 Tax=Exidia glandulosa HHB12029 TaxID=1314781 RepID=A0A165GS77_EXIGL|nr:hypothetical protein EXIGLDRAFT_108850 [Exidia glandulosa HHB12029]
MTPQIPIRRAFSGSGLPLLLLLWLLSFTSFARVSADSGSNTHTTCDPSIANDGNFTWWNNKNGDNPCQVLQNLLRECDSGHTIHLMPASPLTVPDVCDANVIGNTDGENDFSPCCCNTAAYALRQACWSCQQGREDPRKPDRRPTFREYLQCPNTAPNSKKLFKSVHVPKWAFIPVDPDSTWCVRFQERQGRCSCAAARLSHCIPFLYKGGYLQCVRTGG